MSWMCYTPLKCQEPLVLWHSLILLNGFILRNKPVRRHILHFFSTFFSNSHVTSVRHESTCWLLISFHRNGKILACNVGTLIKLIMFISSNCSWRFSQIIAISFVGMVFLQYRWGNKFANWERPPFTTSIPCYWPTVKSTRIRPRILLSIWIQDEPKNKVWGVVNWHASTASKKWMNCVSTVELHYLSK
jgi:hypothetical protein